MNEQSAFDRQHIVELAQLQRPGLLEQLQVPPAAAAWIRRHRRELWLGCVLVLLVFAGWAIYDNYRASRTEKAYSAFAAALKAPEEERSSRLAEVAAAYGSSGAALWARIEQAHLARQRGDGETALTLLSQVEQQTSRTSPLMPLLLYGIATVQEQTGKLDEAMNSYRRLSEIKGFAGLSWLALGQLHEKRSETEAAVHMYEKFLATTTQSTNSSGAAGSAVREMAMARIRALRQ